MNNQSFTPLLGAPTILVGLTALQVPPFGTGPAVTQTTAYRVRCLVAGYLGFNPIVGGNPTTVPPSITAGTPTAAGVNNVIGMAAGQVETFCLPVYCWFISSSAAGFEITAGEGV